ncbi:MAG: RNA 2'-phosphotransferase [Candidatus Omnitrophica bacterium]|nr:RNA 2'-phosphotransferase [Candidatus Omnitrophota bacterium]
MMRNFQDKKIRISKFLSYVLRHDPGKYHLQPGKNGFVSLTEILNLLKKRHKGFTGEELLELVESDPKGRFEIKERRIRARYGHSYDVLPTGEQTDPPEALFHGTSRQNANKILASGLHPMGRKYVHLSLSSSDAYAVGNRHDPEPVVLRILSARAAEEGIKFYKAGSVFLVDHVPAEFIEESGEG